MARIFHRRLIPSTLALLAAPLTIALVASVAAAAKVAEPQLERVEIVLDVDALPQADQERFADRRQAIADAIATGIPLWRSFDPREVLQESLAQLAEHGVDVGETAIVNFDSLEADVPVGKREELSSLGFVRRVLSPAFATPSGEIDSEGLEVIGSDIANAAGLTGAGIKVAIIDSEWHTLNETIAAGELPAIPVSMQFRINGIATTINNQAVHGGGVREHGTAAAEVVHEVAPGATLVLYRLDYNGKGLVTPAAIKLAIRHAVDNGAQVILVPLHIIRTMSDPGSTNPFADDIVYATAAGATVVVPAGNEALRHYEARFTPCTFCKKDDFCNTANDDSSYHVFDGESPINDIILDADWEDWVYASESFNQVRITCYSATDSPNANNFRMQLLRFRERFDAQDPPDYPYCPSDAGVSIVPGTDVALGDSFSKELPVETDSFYDYYFIAVKRMKDAGNERPNFRINCTVGAGEFTYFTSEKSLNDLAVVNETIAVAAGGFPGFDVLLETSSWGPTSDPNGPMKPDLTAPGEVLNFATTEKEFAFLGTFNGTSAAAAHVAGVVALLQSHRIERGLAPFTPAQVKLILAGSAIELDDGDPDLAGPDPYYGWGLVQVPAAILPGVPGDSTRDDWDGDGIADRATYVAATGTLAWTGSTGASGSLQGFGGPEWRAVPADYDGDAKADAAVYNTQNGNWIFEGSAGAIAPLNGFGGAGFLPTVCDWDGDGIADPGVYEKATGNWKYQGSTSGLVQINGFGGPGRLPIPGDWDGDGRCDPATYQKEGSFWSYRGSTEGDVTFKFGGAGAGRFRPVPADYDGDGRMDAALYQKKKGRWRLRMSSFGGVVEAFNGFGGAGFVAVPADFDADGKMDPAIFRKLNNNWRYRSSKTGEFLGLGQFGGQGVQPITGWRP